MVGIPFLALKLLFTRPKLFALAVFPGVFTFALSAAVTYLFWEGALPNSPLWISLPAMIAVFLVSWLAAGNIALLPVEDAIADECQKALWGAVRLPAPRMNLRRILRELAYSVALSLVLLFLYFFLLIPALGLIAVIVSAWVTAYGFLSSLYARQAPSLRGRIRLFLKHGLSNFCLGLAVNFFLFVPILNVFLLGYAQTVASLVFLRREAGISGPNTYRR